MDQIFELTTLVGQEVSEILLSHSETPIAIYQPTNDGLDFLIADINPAFEKLDGVRRNDVVGRLVTDVYSAIEKVGLIELLQRVSSTGFTETHPITVYADNRVSGWRSVQVTRIPSSGNLLLLYGQSTELNDVFNCPYGFVGVFTPKGVLVDINDAPIETAGLSRHDVIGELFWDTYWWSASDAERDRVRTDLIRAAAGDTVSGIYEARSNDLDTFSLEATFKPVFDDAGEVIRVIGFGIDISDRLEIEKALNQSKRLIFSAGETPINSVEDLPLGIAIYNTEEHLLQFDSVLNRSHSDFVPGMTAGQAFRLLAEKFVDINPKDVDTWVDQMLLRFRKPDGPFELPLKNGRILLVEHLKTGSGGTVSIRVDITEQKRAQQRVKLLNESLEWRVSEATRALQQSEQRYRRIVEKLPDMAFARDRGGRIIEVNEAACRKLGYSRDELLRLTIMDLSSIKNLELGANTRRMIRNEEIEFEDQIRCKDGTLIDVEVSSAQTLIGGQQVFLAIARDTTERKLAEQTIRKLSEALEQNPSIVIITDPNGTIEYVNRRFTEVSGYSAGEAIGERPSILKSGLTPRKTYLEMWRAINRGLSWRGEILDRRKDGSTFWVSSSINPIRNDDGEITHYVSMEEDISDRKVVEEKLIAARKEAEAANQSKTSFLTNMSHELRTPLNAILGMAESMQQQIFGKLENEKYQEYAGDILHSGQHLLDLINDLLDLSALEAGGISLNESRVDISKCLDAVYRIVLNQAVAQDIDLRIVLPDGLPSLWADERRLRQAIINLVANAIKYSTPGGEVIISSGCLRDGGMTIDVSDNGVGMDEVGIQKALAPFGRVGSPDIAERDGTGLGLPITAEIIRLHGAELLIDSSLGAGTTVTILFPASCVRPPEV